MKVTFYFHLVSKLRLCNSKAIPPLPHTSYLKKFTLSANFSNMLQNARWASHWQHRRPKTFRDVNTQSRLTSRRTNICACFWYDFYHYRPLLKQTFQPEWWVRKKLKAGKEWISRYVREVHTYWGPGGCHWNDLLIAALRPPWCVPVIYAGRLQSGAWSRHPTSI